MFRGHLSGKPFLSRVNIRNRRCARRCFVRSDKAQRLPPAVGRTSGYPACRDSAALSDLAKSNDSIILKA